MNIKELLQRMHDAQDEEQKRVVEQEIARQFELLSDAEKDIVRNEFMVSLDDRLAYTKEKLAEIDISLDIMEISKYISLSKIASDYFGKSKEWLYQRIKGYTINGKSAKFTAAERKKLSDALEDISRIAHETALKIA